MNEKNRIWDDYPHMVLAYMEKESDEEYKKRIQRELREKENKDVKREKKWKYKMHPVNELDVIRIIHGEIEDETKVIPMVPWSYIKSVRARWGLNPEDNEETEESD